MLTLCRTVGRAIGLVSAISFCVITSVASAEVRVATFKADITPPLGSPLCGGWIKPLVGIDDPLLGKGLMLDDGQHRYVLCALDWCEVRNGAHTYMRTKLAEAVGTQPSFVTVQCLHQHNAPIVDTDAQRLIDMTDATLSLVNVKAFEEAVARLADAAGEAASRLAPCDGISAVTVKVDRIAGTRRVPGPDGKILVRFSSTQDPALHAAPEGPIDPLLRTISFFHQGKPLARLHYYATHPQSYYGDGRASSDFPGLAREQVEAEENVAQIYFTGCAGDVTAGKYNNGSPEARRQLTDRMAAAMREANSKSTSEPLGRIAWRTVLLQLPLRTDSGYVADDGRRAMEDTKQSPTARLNGALLLAFINRHAEPIELAALTIGRVRILHLPGEPFVQFQLGAQRLKPDAFVAVAGYGDGGTGYICSEQSFAEGGYEPTASLVGPRSQQALERAIEQLLADE